MRIAVVTPIPTPYRDPFWNVVATMPNVELHVLYCSRGKSDRPWSVDWDVAFTAHHLSGVNLLKWRSADASLFANPSISRTLRATDCDVCLIGGYNHVTMLMAMRWCRRHGVPYVLMCETYLKKQGGLKNSLRKKIVRTVCRHAAGGLPTGSLASEFLESNGIPASQQVRLPNVPDTVGISAATHILRKAAIDKTTSEGSQRTVLFVGRFIASKRPNIVIEAFSRAASPADRLVLVGDGPQRPECEMLVKDLGLVRQVLFPGFVPPSSVVEWLARSDLFVLPSTETWGVAALEAAAAGVPLVLSDEVGCNVDLLADDRFGVSVKAGDLKAHVDAMRQLLATPNKAFGSEDRHRWVREHSYQALAARMLVGLETIVGRTSDHLQPSDTHALPEVGPTTVDLS